MDTTTTRFRVRSVRYRVWRVIDTTTGVWHTAPMGDRDRAHRIADRLNARTNREATR